MSEKTAKTSVCMSPYGRVKIGNKYVWIDYHTYLGPQFWKDYKFTVPYWPENKNDPIWPEFEKWLAKYNASKEREARRRLALATK